MDKSRIKGKGVSVVMKAEERKESEVTGASDVHTSSRILWYFFFFACGASTRFIMSWPPLTRLRHHARWKLHTRWTSVAE
jgi:hypothetical protein